MNEIVKIRNAMNELKFTGFGAKELDLLMALCAKMRDKDCNDIVFNFAQIKELTKIKTHNKEEFTEYLINMNHKLQQVACEVNTPTLYISFVLFPTFKVDRENEILTVAVNEKFKFMLNDLSANFTRFELSEFISLRSKYSKTLYRLLKERRCYGWYKPSKDNLREYMDCPENCSNKEFMRSVLMPAMKDVSPYFSELKCEPLRDVHKQGKPVYAYSFTFQREKAPCIDAK